MFITVMIHYLRYKFFFKEQFYKNNEAQIWPKIKNNWRKNNPGWDLES